MNYATISFLCFLLMTGIVYFIVPKKLQWLVLLIASLLFYILSCGIMAMFLPAAAAVVYAAGLLLSREDDRLTLRLKEAADMTAMTAADRTQKEKNSSRFGRPPDIDDIVH